MHIALTLALHQHKNFCIFQRNSVEHESTQNDRKAAKWGRTQQGSWQKSSTWSSAQQVNFTTIAKIVDWLLGLDTLDALRAKIDYKKNRIEAYTKNSQYFVIECRRLNLTGNKNISFEICTGKSPVSTYWMVPQQADVPKDEMTLTMPQHKIIFHT